MQVIDVAGGHGALAALFLILQKSVVEAVVIDPAVIETGKTGIEQAWGRYIPDRKALRYRHECLRTALPGELVKARAHRADLSDPISSPKPRPLGDVLVVACHACQHLTDEVCTIAAAFGAHVAVMPCCHKDHSGTWKAAGRVLNVPLGVVCDLLLAGRMGALGRAAGVRYDVRMRCIKPETTPQNRIIVARAKPLDVMDACDELAASAKLRAHDELTRAYVRAHRNMRSAEAGALPTASTAGDEANRSAGGGAPADERLVQARGKRACMQPEQRADVDHTDAREPLPAQVAQSALPWQCMAATCGFGFVAGVAAALASVALVRWQALHRLKGQQ